MNYPYEEQQVIEFALDCVKVLPNDAGRIGVNCARMQFDAVTIGYLVSRTKHLNELYNELGIPISFPPKPSRDRVLHGSANFCNLLDSSGLPIFSSLIGGCNPDKRQDWINCLLRAGSTHCNVVLSGDYGANLGWIDRYPIIGKDFTKNLLEFRALLEEIITSGLIPIVDLSCDGFAYDPNGLTYGWQWGMNNCPDIIKQLRFLGNGIDLAPYCLWTPTFDSGFPTWNRDQTLQFVGMMRSALGVEGNILLELAPGGDNIYIHLGGGSADYYTSNGLEIDAIGFETPIPPEDRGNYVGAQQIASRMLGPLAENVRPENAGPYYFETSRPRGPVICWVYETVAYSFIRKQVNTAYSSMTREWWSFYGFSDFGNNQL